MTRWTCLRMGQLMVLGLGLCLCACNAANVFVASPSDYADYRRIRLAERLDDRLSAAAAYLERHPDGRYAQRVERYLQRAEPVYFKVRRRSAPGLSAYLRALPQGANQAQAVAELVRERRREKGETLSDQLARETQSRLDSEVAQRREASALLGRWIGALLDVRSWDVRLSQARPELLVPYRVALPQPTCSEDGDGWRCVKVLRRSFPISSREEPVTRAVEMQLELTLDTRWRLKRARLRGSAILERVTEARRNKLFDSNGEVGFRGEKVRSELFEEVIAMRGKSGQSCGLLGGTGRKIGCGALQLTWSRDAAGQEVIVIAKGK